MSLERDIQSKLAVVHLSDVTVEEETTYVGDAIDTFGFRGVAFVLEATIDDADEITLNAQDSADGVAYEDVEYIQILPTRKWEDNLMVTPVNGYLQTFGVVSADRYVRPEFVVDALTSQSITIAVHAILIPENMDFLDWDPDVTGDGMP